MTTSTPTIPANIIALLGEHMVDGQITGLPSDQLAQILGLATKSSKTTKKTKKSRDPSKPKRPQSAYFLWLADNRETIGQELEDKELKGKEKQQSVLKKAGELWKLVSDEDKTPYMESFKKDQERYKGEMSEYTPTAPTYDSSDYPEPPHQWSGPFRAKYLFKSVKGEDGKTVKSFKSFDDAIQMANELGDKCGGITKTSRGYSLRIGPDLITTPDAKLSSGLASWIKGDPEQFTPFTPESEQHNTPVEKKKKVVKFEEPEPTPVAESDPTPDPTPVAETETTVKKGKGKGRGRPKGSSNKKKTPEPEPVQEPEPEPEQEPDQEEEEHNSEDEDDEEEMEVSEVTHKGKTYYYDESSGNVYDPETSEVVGKMVEGEVQLE